MSERQQAEFDATLHQAPVDLRGDVRTLRAGFEEVMRRVPAASNTRTTQIEIGGVHPLPITVDRIDPENEEEI
jgi:hypothetical protein